MVDQNGAQAVIRAGYSQHGARQAAHILLTNIDILAVVRLKQAEMSDEFRISRQGMLQTVVEGIRMAFEKKDPMAIFRGVQEINKMCGFYTVPTEKIDQREDGETLRKRMESMSDAALLKMAREAN